MSKVATLTEEEELAILFPEPTPFKIGGITLSILPMDTATCARFSNKARPIIKQMMPGGPLTMEKMLAGLALAIADYPDEMIQALAIATGRAPEFIGKLPPTVTGALVMTIFSVNADFFSRGVGSLVSDAQAMLSGKTGDGAGLTH